jgi:exopolyphosphatase/guanosine-5'-triphosphate,3'-diphosphate pyrophosphatase
LRLIDMTGGRLDKALEIADERIGALPWIGDGRGRTFYAVGGTWRALAKMYMEQTRHPLRVMQGYAITTREALAYCEMVRRTRKLTGLAGFAEVSKPRRESIPYGAMVLERLLKRIEPRDVVFSVFGIREGLIYEMLTGEEQAKDPLLSFCMSLATRSSRSAAHGLELAEWTDAIFDATSGPKETPAERRLRHAACILSDVGWRAHPDYRGEQTLNLIAHAGLGGIDHAGRIFLALSVYFRHANEADSEGDHLSARLKQAVPRRALKRARILGAAVRSAHMLSIGKSGIIPRTPVSLADGRLTLRLPADLAPLDGERLRRRFSALAALLDCTPEIATAG